MPARLLIRSQTFARRSAALTAGRPELGQALASAIRLLWTTDDLPGPLDGRAIAPPRGVIHHVRHVTGANLWIYYRVDAERLLLAHLVDQPPYPVDSGHD